MSESYPSLVLPKMRYIPNHFCPVFPPLPLRARINEIVDKLYIFKTKANNNYNKLNHIIKWARINVMYYGRRHVAFPKGAGKATESLSRDSRWRCPQQHEAEEFQHSGIRRCNLFQHLLDMVKILIYATPSRYLLVVDNRRRHVAFPEGVGEVTESLSRDSRWRCPQQHEAEEPQHCGIRH